MLLFIQSNATEPGLCRDHWLTLQCRQYPNRRLACPSGISFRCHFLVRFNFSLRQKCRPYYKTINTQIDSADSIKSQPNNLIISFLVNTVVNPSPFELIQIVEHIWFYHFFPFQKNLMFIKQSTLWNVPPQTWSTS